MDNKEIPDQAALMNAMFPNGFSKGHPFYEELKVLENYRMCFIDMSDSNHSKIYDEGLLKEFVDYKPKIMKDKYYTPEIEEFYVGFEYETRHGSKWFKVNNVQHIPHGHKNLGDLYRIKYLDKEDIESLGWEYESITKEVLKFKMGKYVLQYDTNLDDKHKYMLTIYETINDTGRFHFLAPVKNKSELKRLMKQLQISKDD